MPDDRETRVPHHRRERATAALIHTCSTYVDGRTSAHFRECRHRNDLGKGCTRNHLSRSPPCLTHLYIERVKHGDDLRRVPADRTPTRAGNMSTRNGKSADGTEEAPPRRPLLPPHPTMLPMNSKGPARCGRTEPCSSRSGQVRRPNVEPVDNGSASPEVELPAISLRTRRHFFRPF